MNTREKSLLEARLDRLTQDLKGQHSIRKELREPPSYTADLKARIRKISDWMRGSPVIPTRTVILMDKATFKQAMDTVLERAPDAAAAMIIPDRKTLDAVYHKIKFANIQISAPPDVMAYYKEKLRKERPYQQ